ncbi:Kelch motif protein [Terriglobus roseus DSM 18391]|uniref:Kelch motif protein n=1 Tax=Terriglobus roseus (strain DSM 18391 / NRRL B-41598 / KBS 63) TaxID=926566 RepID=I3ZL19_TERRK|nr:kelch motif-containing protein [Terriglobus roseus]AFL89937.1 Kelch motif protein [Terriglobus roseus DSM 18391]
MRLSFLCSLFLSVALSTLTGCGGAGSGGSPRSGDPTPTPAPATVTVAIAPSSVSLFLLEKQQFSTTVTGTADTRVAFEVVNGGSASTSGLYVAPNKAMTAKVRAWSVADPTKYAEAQVQVSGYAEMISDKGGTPEGYDRHTAELLPDGSVLLIGGWGTGALHTRAERYLNGSAGVVPAGTMVTPRQGHASVSLADDKVLVTGGYDRITSANLFREVFKTSEIYDPAQDRFTAGPLMNRGRREHTMTLLADGRVLVVGGISQYGPDFSSNTESEIYSPVTGRFDVGPSTKDGRWQHTATRLKDGRVLVVGGRPNNCAATCSLDALKTAEIFDPATNKWSSTGSLRISRSGHSAGVLDDGRVVIFGGMTNEDQNIRTQQVAQVEVWDPATGKFTDFGTLHVGRTFHALVRLLDGRFLLANGYDEVEYPSATTEIFDPVTQIATNGPNTLSNRFRGTATLLSNGQVLITSGNDTTSSGVRYLEVFR